MENYAKQLFRYSHICRSREWDKEIAVSFLLLAIRYCSSEYRTGWITSLSTSFAIKMASLLQLQLILFLKSLDLCCNALRSKLTFQLSSMLSNNQRY